MPTVAEVVRRYGGAYLKKFGQAVPVEHRKVLAMIARCRTGELGTVVYRWGVTRDSLRRSMPI
jgi:hypothetical protein